VLSIKLIYLELLISHFIRPVESSELPNLACVSKSLETPALRHEVVWGSGCIDPHFLDLGTSWR
jgi:hypothetical protein